MFTEEKSGKRKSGKRECGKALLVATDIRKAFGVRRLADAFRTRDGARTVKKRQQAPALHTLRDEGWTAADVLHDIFPGKMRACCRFLTHGVLFHTKSGAEPPHSKTLREIMSFFDEGYITWNMNAGQRPINGTPPAEFEITSALVTALLSDQHPDLAHLPLRLVAEGWDNTMFRLGDRLAVRLPRRAAAAKLICHEQAWLPRLAPQLTLPVPTPCRIGSATRDYPWPWSVVPWLAGKAAAQDEPLASQANAWGNFLRSLHVPAPRDAPSNPVRGVPLRERATSMQERLQRLSTKTGMITSQIRHVWEAGLLASLDPSPTWLHGDLHPCNVLVNDGIISGVIDWGDMTSGDRATDLASIWMLFDDPRAHRDALATYGEVSEATLQRAKAWAVFFGVMFLDTGLTDNPPNAELGERILRRVDLASDGG